MINTKLGPNPAQSATLKNLTDICARKPFKPVNPIPKQALFFFVCVSSVQVFCVMGKGELAVLILKKI